MHKVTNNCKYRKLDQEDQIELLTVSMEEDAAVKFSGRKPTFTPLESSVSVNTEKDSLDGGEEGFVTIPVSGADSQLTKAGRDMIEMI